MAKRKFPPYDPEAAQRLFDGMDAGLPVRDICQTDGMPDLETFQHWRKTNKEFSAGYAAAMERKRGRAKEETKMQHSQKDRNYSHAGPKDSQ